MTKQQAFKRFVLWPPCVLLRFTFMLAPFLLICAGKVGLPAFRWLDRRLPSFTARELGLKHPRWHR